MKYLIEKKDKIYVHISIVYIKWSCNVKIIIWLVYGHSQKIPIEIYFYIEQFRPFFLRILLKFKYHNYFKKEILVKF
jgi:hypothetical protein